MHWSTPAPKPSIKAPYEGTEPALMTPYEGIVESTDIKKTEQVSPRQGTHQPHNYQKAQVIDLTDATGKVSAFLFYDSLVLKLVVITNLLYCKQASIYSYELLIIAVLLQITLSLLLAL